MRTCDPKSFVSVGAPATVPPTRLFVTYMSAQEQSSKLEAIAIKGFIIFSATDCSSPRADGCVASVLQLSCRTLGKMRQTSPNQTGGLGQFRGSTGSPRRVRPVAGKMPVGPTVSEPDWPSTPVLLRLPVAAGATYEQAHDCVGRDG